MTGYNASSTSIIVSWDEVPPDQQNGIITGYTITYQSQTQNDNGNVSAGPNDRRKNITGLKEYVDYNIRVFASTVKGNGPHSSPVFVVRTDQDSKLFSEAKLLAFFQFLCGKYFCKCVIAIHQSSTVHKTI